MFEQNPRGVGWTDYSWSLRPCKTVAKGLVSARVCKVTEVQLLRRTFEDDEAAEGNTFTQVVGVRTFFD